MSLQNEVSAVGGRLFMMIYRGFTLISAFDLALSLDDNKSFLLWYVHSGGGKH